MPEPVTIIIRRSVKPGSEVQYEEQLNELARQAKELDGYLGAEFHRPIGQSRTYTSIVRFSDLSALEKFEASELRSTFLRRVEPYVSGDAVWQKLTGLEFWFEPPVGTQVPQPSQFRMALLLILVVFLLVYVIGGAIGALLNDWPYFARLLLTITIEIFIMTYLIMPRLTKTLARWIYPSSHTKS